MRGEMRNVIGRKIRFARHMAELTQADLAKRVGIDKTYISKIELGRVEVDDELIGILANKLHVTVNNLLGKEAYIL